MIKIAKEFLSLAHCVQKSGTLWNRVTWTAYLFINIVQKHQNNISNYVNNMSIFFSYEHICTCDIPVISSSYIEP
jgi:hypothetical protein